jgi:hypothetical protein
VNQRPDVRVALRVAKLAGGLMQTPVHIDFQGIDVSPTTRESVEKHVVGLSSDLAA